MTAITPLLLVLYLQQPPQNPAQYQYDHWSQGRAILEQQIIEDYLHHPNPDRREFRPLERRLEWPDTPMEDRDGRD